MQVFEERVAQGKDSWSLVSRTIAGTFSRPACLGSSPTALPHDQLKLAVLDRANDDRLQQADFLNGGDEFSHRVFVEDGPGLLRVRGDRGRLELSEVGAFRGPVRRVVGASALRLRLTRLRPPGRALPIRGPIHDVRRRRSSILLCSAAGDLGGRRQIRFRAG